MLLRLEDLQAWLRSTAVLLRGCDRGLVLTARDCREMEKLCRRAADIAGAAAEDAREAEQRRRRDATMAEAATGGPPPLPPEPVRFPARPRIVAAPQLGPNVVALIPAAARRPVLTTEESDHA